MTSRPHFPMLRRLLICAAVLTALSAAEDLLNIIRLGLETDLSSVLSGEMKERSVSESILDIILLGGMALAGAKILLGALSAAPSEAAIRPPEDLPAEDRFAESIGLSRREKEHLPQFYGKRAAVHNHPAFI